MPPQEDSRDSFRLSQTPHSLHDFLTDASYTDILRIVLSESYLELTATLGDAMLEVTCHDNQDNFEWRRNQTIAEVKGLVEGDSGDPVIEWVRE